MCLSDEVAFSQSNLRKFFFKIVRYGTSVIALFVHVAVFGKNFKNEILAETGREQIFSKLTPHVQASSSRA